MLTRQQLIDAPEDEYMNEEQLAFFEDLLKTQIAETTESVESTMRKLKEEQIVADELDRAQVEEDHRTRLRFMDRQTKLLPKLREALKRVEAEEFGYCEVTGDPIGVKRLLARPTATLCTAEKTRQEQQEKSFRSTRP
jgi:DnaK suppressor protein